VLAKKKEERAEKKTKIEQSSRPKLTHRASKQIINIMKKKFTENGSRREEA